MDRVELEDVRGAVEAWYADGHRRFPWRGSRDPWAVLVSEVMLQQTQASRVAERFPPFMARYPTPAALASAPTAEVLTAWAGLGYNRRALALQSAAAAVRDGWPPTLAGLEALPGVGPYTARAVASLAFGQAVGVVDTNVRRWLSRYAGVPSGDRRALQELADRLAAPGAGDGLRTADWTHASIELGARICTSRRPRCAECPVARSCRSRDRQTGSTTRRAASFNGSSRQARGAVVRWLTEAPGHTLPVATLRRRLAGLTGPPRPGWSADGVLAALERDGLTHPTGRWVRLGPAATIRA